ncbi:hypothetical protein PLICRDRAFT_96165 [Plicaturopsis crispa FD-325 SS-3]|nr:hypothetical protein PLICRDRAFT_96165 [Plicaturopsis crispa FD-325 SS-3]
MSIQPPATLPSILLPEILGFSPQLFLDDIINVANDVATETVNGLESFLIRWADDRTERNSLVEWDSTQEVEQGLVSFQTLLESHVDIAFDFLEVWSKRNIFAFDADLEIVVPHQKGLDLQIPPEEEQELMAEIDELRRKIDNQNRLKRLYMRAVRKSSVQLHRSRARLEKLSVLDVDSLKSIAAVAPALSAMHASVSSLPPLDPTQVPAPVTLKDFGKREWETSKTGYLNWATGSLMQRTVGSSGGVNEAGMLEGAASIGPGEWIKATLESEGAVVPARERPRREEEESMEIDE